MAESTLTPTKANTILDVERYLALAAGAEAAWIARLFTAGYRKAVIAYDWSFLKVTGTITTVEPYETGTVTIVAGVVTLAGGTFPTWAASGVLIIDNISYRVSVRDSGTQLTLVDTSVAAAALTEYRIVQEAYALPDNFGEFDSPLTYHPGVSQGVRRIKLIDERDLRVARFVADSISAPTRAALRPKTFVAATGQRFELVLEPLADAVYQLTYRYRVNPDAWGTSEFTYGGMMFGELVRLAILSVAEIERNEAPGPYQQLYLEQLALCIRRDTEANMPDTLGRLTDPCEYGDYDGSESSHVIRGETYPPYA